MKLVEKTDPILKTKLQDFNFIDPPVDPIHFALQLVSFMRQQNAIGLAANQVGEPHRVFCVFANPIIACYNPILVTHSDEQSYLMESCLSFPGDSVNVKRPDWIRLRYTEPNGNVQTKKFVGLTARLMQHELDHLDGLTMFDRSTRYHREMAKKKKRNNE